MRNRTMPPLETKLTEEERLRVATWIDTRLRQTACAVGDYAGAVALRRMNKELRSNDRSDVMRDVIDELEHRAPNNGKESPSS